ncbi:MAG: PA0069 family radical SAM protein [Geminicoccaceae bacterium]|nr:PA0069 family radical SAM protein [Geminicoccaceae bacterium]MDW8342771.1 PA0069 family radical SAM protein [Geminicoccaceae bacterium]
MRAEPRRGRGATTNPAGRFARTEIEPFDDGWGGLAERAAQPARPTEVRPDRAQSLLTRNRSPDVGFDRSANPYRGCEHGCIYCYARPSHAFLDLSPGLDFETVIFAKERAAELLRAELARPGYVCAPIALGTNTDVYQPIERRLGITRAILEVLIETRHPFSITTKGAGILRDLDLLAEAASLGLVRVAVSLTTLEPLLARTMEPRAAAPWRRLDIVRALARAGVPVGVNLAPLIPGLNDHEIERIAEAAAEAGARWLDWVLVRLPHEVKELFRAWLEAHFPDRAARVLGLVRACRGGRLNDPRFGSRMRGEGVYADFLAQRVVKARRRFGLDRSPPPLRGDRFRPPENPRQLALF